MVAAGMAVSDRLRLWRETRVSECERRESGRVWTMVGERRPPAALEGRSNVGEELVVLLAVENGLVLKKAPDR